uniref:Acyl-coenzyme A oxidase n=1 Tax=Ciona savignyi TaxID=51511 RepID=H2ZFH4_CIOSA
ESQLIIKERQQTTFQVEELINLLDGGKEKTALRRSIEQTILSDPLMKTDKIGYLTREQKYVQSVRRMMYFFTDLAKRNKWNIEDPHCPEMLFLSRSLSSVVAFMIHMGAFVPSISSFGTLEQVSKWQPLAKECLIIGCYAQTELGHGTNLRRLETTSTFDRNTQEFIVNTPNLSSMKWWPGDMGKSANHAMVMAQLITNGENHGMQAFIVPIRDMTTHKPLPGVEVGNIGSIMSLEDTDNGYLRLNNVRIPKENMLAKYANVDRSGRFQQTGNNRLMYASMMNLRIVLTREQMIHALQKACTIAARYSCVRKQGSLTPNGPEIPIMDYVTQQNKVIPRIALAYALDFTIMEVRHRYVQFLADVTRGDLSNMAEMHAISSGIKANASERTVAGVETLRRACGGHGYSMASGLPYLLLSVTGSCTYEGENTVLYLQVARYLIKTAANISMGKSVDGSSAYLAENTEARCSATSQEEFYDHSLLDACFKHRSKQLLQSVAMDLQGLLAEGKQQMEAWNLLSIQLVNSAKAHIERYIVATSASFVRKLNCSLKVKKLLNQLCSLVALHQITNFPGDFLKDGYLDSHQLDLARKAEVKLLQSLRHNVVGLVDAFDFRDEILGSCIGAYDGNAYERLYDYAKNDVMNKNDVHEESYQYLRPHLHRG